MSDTSASSTDQAFRNRAQQLEKMPPCQARCPNSGDIRGWLGIIAQHEKLGLNLDEAYDHAWRKLTELNPLPATVGRICPHPCEDQCTRLEKDGAISINAVERFLGDWAISRGLALPVAEMMHRNASVGVIGSGPASLSFAYQMSRRGYPVTLYERFDKPGGMLRNAIPEYRLPAATLDAEIQRILDLPVALVLNADVGGDIGLDELQRRHTAIFLGPGAQAAKALGIPGERGPGVLSGIDYLLQRKHRRVLSPGDRVVVIGGGNTAIDAARTARREDTKVTVVYRRGREEMPAADGEVDDALSEGVEFEFLASPTRIFREHNVLCGLEIQPMRLEQADAEGRPHPVPIAGQTRHLPADVVIVAVSQALDWRGTGLATGDGQKWLVTDNDGWIKDNVWAGGDARGPGIASRAIGQGRVAAEAAHARLSGEYRGSVTNRKLVERHMVKPDYYPGQVRGDKLRRPQVDWLRAPNMEIDLTLPYAAAHAEAARCMSCGLCFDCEQCFMYCNAGGFTRIDEARPGNYFVLALEACEGCGKCIEVCPCGFLETREEPTAQA